MEEVIAGIRNIYSAGLMSLRNIVREASKQIIMKNMYLKTGKKLNNPVDNYKVIKGLWEKDCFYVKAEKGNKVVILDKEDYFDRLDILIANGPNESLLKIHYQICSEK